MFISHPYDVLFVVDNRVDGLQRTMDTGQETIGLVQGLIQEGVEFMDLLIESLSNVMEDVFSLLETVNNGICPGLQETICTNLTDVSTCNSTRVIADGSLVLEPLVKHFYSDRSLVSKLIQARDDLAGLIIVADEMNEQADTFDWALSVAMVFALLLSLLSLSMMVGLCFQNKLPRIIKCIQSRVLMPTFLLFVVVSFIFAMVFIIASLGLADTCVDDPDTRLLFIAEVYLRDSSPIVFEFVQLYLSRTYKYLYIYRHRCICMSIFVWIV
jgi:hypothetical protein